MGEPSMDWGAPLKGAQLSERQDSLWGEGGLGGSRGRIRSQEASR